MSAAPSLTTQPLEAALLAAETEGRDANVKRWLRFAHVCPGDVVELQALAVPFGNAERTYVAHASTSSEVLRLLDEAKPYRCPGIYFIANRVDPAVATRLGLDKWNPAPKGASTTDRDIVCRTVLFVDVDSERPRGTSATDAELDAAIEVATEVHGWLARALGGEHALGYSASGNGRGIYIALNDIAEVDAAPRVKAILVGLDAGFSTAKAKIDTAVSDAKRLVPAHGTMKRKGATGIAERPHRMTCFTCADRVSRIEHDQLDHVVVVLRELLDEAGNVAMDKALGIKPAKSSAARSTPLEAESPFARANAVDVSEVLAWLGQLEGDRPRCPGCGEADSGVAIVKNGMKCSHARCASKGYREGFRTPVDLVAEVRDVAPKEAVALMAERFGFEGFRPAAAPAASTHAPAPQRRSPMKPGDRVRALAELGPLVRLETGIPTLDRACRGGLPTRRLVVAGGAPGAGKTTVVTNWAWRWAKSGIAVGVLAVDEGPEGTITRIAQLEGIAPERIEERDPAALARLAGLLDASTLILVDGEDDAGTVEGVAELVAKAAGKGIGVLIVDSIQTVRAAGTDTVDSPRERVDAVVRALKRVRDRFGLLVLATCELARGAYRSRSVAETINDLAAFKESGSVEYAAQTALVLRSVPDEASLVDVTVPKNRAYRREPFRLRLDLATTALTEVEYPAGPIGGRSTADHLEEDVQAVRKVLLESPGINGARAVRHALRARRAAMSNDRVGGAMEYLRARGEVENRGTERRPALYLRKASREEIETDD